MQVNQIRAGAALSYVSMALSTIISLVYTPIMLRQLGDSEFGVYQAVLPIISYLNLLSFGLGSAYVRYYSRFRAAGDKQGCAKLNGMFLLTYLLLGAAVLGIAQGAAKARRRIPAGRRGFICGAAPYYRPKNAQTAREENTPRRRGEK